MNQTTATRRTGMMLTIGLLLAAASGGCSTVSPQVPAEWQAVDTEHLAKLDPGENTVYQSIAAATPPRAQLLICYGPVMQTHAALRLEDGPDRVVYWDPGGDFGRNDTTFNRVRDVMTGPHATLQRLWHYRRSECGNDAMLVYEFDLPRQEVRRLQDYLVFSSRNPGGNSFATATTPSQCNRNLCKFLQQEMSGRLDIPQRWLYPHDLGDHLWSQKPSRAILFRDRERPLVYVPPQRESPAAASTR